MEDIIKEYNNIRDFLEKEPEKYDFSDYGAPDGYKKKKGLEKYFVYKIIAGVKETFNHKVTEHSTLYRDGEEKWKKIKEKYNKICDPDSDCKLLQDIYSVLWKEYIDDNDKKSKKVVEKFKKVVMKNEKIQGETLNSAQTTLSKMYKMAEKPEHRPDRTIEIHEEPEKSEHGTQQKKLLRQDISLQYMVSRYYAKDEKDKEDFSFLRENAVNFLNTYHTLGNFMPVPVGCNGPRGKGSVKDYFDLTLYCIEKYYNDGKNKEWIKKIIGAKEELVQRYVTWLEVFGCWENFVEKNYLEDFVGDDNKPKELWENHFEQWNDGKGCAFPKQLDKNSKNKAEQCDEYFKNATCCIKMRTRKMIIAILMHELKKIYNNSSL